jgi:ubiquinone/menaquinone biosynthesis C-methylase UbiE
MSNSVANQSPAELVERWLACPNTHERLVVDGSSVSGKTSGFSGEIRDGVAVMSSVVPSFFDSRFEVMQKGHKAEGEWSFCYDKQTTLLEGYFRPGQLVLDVGCGPSLPYKKPKSVSVIGLESSFDSIRANQDVDLRVFGSASAIPMADVSVDIVVCFYSVHHMVGARKTETAKNVSEAIREFGRVLKPDGWLFIYEMTPMSPFRIIQDLFWNVVRKAAPKTLDMYFFSAAEICRIGEAEMPAGSTLERIFFGASAFTIIPPIFSLPWFKVPRLFYPLDAKLYKWRKPAH